MAAGGVWLVLSGRDGGDDSQPPVEAQPAVGTTADAGSSPDTSMPARPDGPVETTDPARPAKVLPESTCPPELTNCEVASGRVVFVEKVDPDGDGDAHFVTASSDSITGPGVTIFDVRPDLRPDPLPGVGDLVGGAGPVYPGSAGQKQIEVVEFHVAE